MEYIVFLLAQAGRLIVRSLARFYYKPVVIHQRDRVPSQGPLLVTANHPNSLIDPVLVGLTVRRPVHFLAKAPLFNVPVFGSLLKAFGMIPAYRKVDAAAEVKNNTASLSAGVDVLKRSEVLGIFPEGKSHDELKVDQVKTGAARMAVDAYEKGLIRLVVLPIGLNYEQKDRFRSAVWISVGEPIVMQEWMKSASTDSRQAMRELNHEIDRRLKQVVIHLEDTSHASLLADLDSIIQDAQDPATGLLRRKNISEALNHFLQNRPEEVEPLISRITAFSTLLRSHGVSADLPVFRKNQRFLFWQMFRDALSLLAGSLIALAGTLYHLVPYATVRLTGWRLKSTGNMATATTRLCLSVPLYLTWYVFAWLALRLYFLPWVAWTVTALMPLAGVIAATYWSALLKKNLQWFRQIRLLSDPKTLQSLRREYAHLKKDLLSLDASFLQQYPERRYSPPDVVPNWWTWPRLAAAAFALLLLVAGYLTLSLPQSRPLELSPIAAAEWNSLSGEDLASQLTADEKSLLAVLGALQTLRESSTALETAFRNGERNFYRQEDNDAIRALLLSYLNIRNALLRLLCRYQNTGAIEDPSLQARAELLQIASATVLFESSGRFINRFADNQEIIRKLNEAEPLWEVPAGLYDEIRRNLSHPENIARLEEAWAYYRSREKDYQDLGLWTGSPYDEIHLSIRSSARLGTIKKTPWAEALALRVHDIFHVGKTTKYQAGILVSCWIGDTKIRAPRDGKTLIQAEQLEILRSQLQPGDIILERRNWYLSNAFLPGYWPHSALYLGTPEELQKLGITTDPRVKTHWEEFLKKDKHGHSYALLESMSEGVVFTSLEYSVGGADSVAVLRPRLQSYQLKEALCRAFSHKGKPYDFDFDFFSTDKLVCTELVFRSYDGYLNFPLVDILGRKTLPALEMVRAYEKEKGEKKPRLEFIAFLDGDESKGEAIFADEAAFLSTLQRPALTWLQPFAKQ